MKKIISYVLVLFIFISTAALIVHPLKGPMIQEQRDRTSFPGKPVKIRVETIREYFNQIDRWVADNFPLRDLLLSATFLNANIPEVQDMGSVFRGKENWLYLGNNYDNILDKLQGRKIADKADLTKLLKKFTKLKELADKYDAKHAVIVCPNKSSVYAEFLPDLIYPSRSRYLIPIVTSLNQNGIAVYDLTDTILNNKGKDLLYYRTDSHWNNLGAAKAFEKIRQLFNWPEVPSFSISPDKPFKGDLYSMGDYKFDIPDGDNYKFTWNKPYKVLRYVDSNQEVIDMASALPFELLLENCRISNKHSIIDKVAWIYADSFTMALTPFLNATFKEVYYIHNDQFDDEARIPKGSNPDFIFYISVERKL